jgi:hypothetical protein
MNPDTLCQPGAPQSVRMQKYPNQNVLLGVEQTVYGIRIPLLALLQTTKSPQSLHHLWLCQNCSIPCPGDTVNCDTGKTRKHSLP